MNSLKSEHYASVLPYSQCIRVLKVIRIKIICCSVTQLCPTVCDPMDCSTPGFRSSLSPGDCSDWGPLSSWCHPTISSSVIPFSSGPPSAQHQGLFQMNQLFASGGQTIGVSASTSVLPMNIQGWFPLGWTGLISLLSKGLSRIYSGTTVQKHQFLQCSAFFTVQLSHPHMTTRKTIAFHFLPLSKCKGESIILRAEKLLMGNDTAS